MKSKPLILLVSVVSIFFTSYAMADKNATNDMSKMDCASLAKMAQDKMNMKDSSMKERMEQCKSQMKNKEHHSNAKPNMQGMKDNMHENMNSGMHHSEE